MLLLSSLLLNCAYWFKLIVRACLHGGGGPQVGGVTHQMLSHLTGVPHLHVNRPSMQTFLSIKWLLSFVAGNWWNTLTVLETIEEQTILERSHYAVLKRVVWLYIQLRSKWTQCLRSQASHAQLVVHMLSRKRKPGAWRPPVNVSKLTRILPPRNPVSWKKLHLDCVFDFQRICSLHFCAKNARK